MPYVGIFSIKASKKSPLPRPINPKNLQVPYSTIPNIREYSSTIPNPKYYFLFQISSFSLSSMSLLSLLLSFSPQQSNLNSSLSSHLSLAHGGGYFLAGASTWVMWLCGLWVWWPKLGRGFSDMDVGYAWQGGSWQARSQRAVSRLHGVDFDEVGHRLMVEVSGFWFWVGFDGV